MGNPDLLTPRQLSAFLDLDVTSTIVDVGCGTGSLTSYLVRNCRTRSWAVGLDIDRDALQRAQSKQEFLAVQAEATRLPVRSDSADLVLCRRLLMNLPGPIEALREMVRVAKPGGLVAVMEPDFLAEHGCSSVPGELDFHRRLLRSTSGGSDLGFGRKTPTLLKQAGLREIRPMVHAPVVAAPGGKRSSSVRESSVRSLVQVVRELRDELAKRVGPGAYESFRKEAERLDVVRERQLRRGEYISASSFPLWIVKGRKPSQGD
ncbi:MAG: methyltransferase domain-containing protein [Thermoplasmata archaeon]